MIHHFILDRVIHQTKHLIIDGVDPFIVIVTDVNFN
jgi:hypothetical protein